MTGINEGRVHCDCCLSMQKQRKYVVREREEYLLISQVDQVSAGYKMSQSTFLKYMYSR